MTAPSGDLKVDHGHLDLAATDLTGASRHLQAIIDGLESELEKRQQSWSGAAKAAYLPAKATWTSAITELQVLLADLGRAVDQSNLAYLQADLQGARLFG